MTLSAGSRLGPYEILGPLGAGGMGEVYRARDTRLERTVAVKVLPQHLSSAPDVRQRFEREARTISQLSHPNICALFDVGHQDGVDYLVMEYLEGETLADRLSKGAVPLDQTLRFGIEVADALGKAHRQGIVHRDLKPGNIMLTRSGVKLLDFGLAKAFGSPSGPGTGVTGLTALPTKADLTQQGTIVGTIQYMAPEQLEGKDADARADLFALGTVLYEMATGKKAFTGSSQASLISAIMKDEPAPMAQLQPTTPPALDQVVRTCLAKDPDDRWQSAHDLKTSLKWLAAGGTPGKAAAPGPARGTGRELLAWGVAALALLVAAGVLLRGGAAAPVPLPMRVSIALPDQSRVRSAALSPDGTRLAVVARDVSGTYMLSVRALDSSTLRPLPGTEHPSFPFWSPDSRFIGFFADGKLKKIDPSGGPPQTLCDAPTARGGTWSRDGVILFAPVTEGPIFRVPSSGGAPTAVTRFDPKRGETTHRWPWFLPDGRHFLYLVGSFAVRGDQEKLGIYAASLDGGEDKFLSKAVSSMAYAPPGYVLFFRDGSLIAQPFDARDLRITGESFAVAERVEYFPQIYNTLFSVSTNGSLVYGTRATSDVSQLLWLDRGGRLAGSLGAPADQSNPRLSPDGRRVAMDITDPQTGNIDIWTYETAGGIATRFTSDPAIDSAPIWSPDGRSIVFNSMVLGHPDMYRKSANGAGSTDTIFKSGRSKVPTDWSPDGRNILFRATDAKSNLELWVAPAAGDGPAVPFLKTSFGVSHGQFSPDGRFVAYQSNESGRWEIYVAPFPGPGGSWKVSSAGGAEPRWRRDGKELFYIAADGTLMAVTVRTEGTFDADAARPLFTIRRREITFASDLFCYDVSPDGQRFLVNSEVPEPSFVPLNLILNWTSEIGK